MAVAVNRHRELGFIHSSRHTHHLWLLHHREGKQSMSATGARSLTATLKFFVSRSREPPAEASVGVGLQRPVTISGCGAQWFSSRHGLF